MSDLPIWIRFAIRLNNHQGWRLAVARAIFRVSPPVYDRRGRRLSADDVWF